MSSTASLEKRIAREFSDDETVGFDLLSQLTYMSALAASGATRDRVVEHTIRQPFVTAGYLRQVHQLVRRLGFQYARAFRAVAETTRIPTIKSLLLRFAGSMQSGGTEAEFIGQEAGLEMERHTARYERNLEALKKWTDAYAALMVSTTMILVVSMVSTMLYKINPLFLTILGGTMISMVGLGVYIIFRTAPAEKKAYSEGKGPVLRRMGRTLLYVLGPSGVIAGWLLGGRYGLGAGLLVFGLAILPSGILAFIEDRKMDALERDLPNFIRTLGNLTSALGTTFTVALQKMDRQAMGSLAVHLRLLTRRLSFRLNPAVAWRKLAEETGSELIARTTRAFHDATELGGPPDRVGEICAAYAMRTSLLRAKRRLTADSFSFLVIPLHAAMAGLVVFILEIVVNFSQRLSALVNQITEQLSQATSYPIPAIKLFSTPDLGLVTMITQILIVALTLANGLTPALASGGHRLNILFYTGIMSITSGLGLLLIPPLAASIFKS